MIVRLLIQFAAMVAAVVIMVQIVPGIEVDSFAGYVQIAVVLAIVNTFVRPLIRLISAPLILMTLGLFLFVINAVLLRVVIGIVDDASIDGFGSALVGSIILTLASMGIGWALGIGEDKKA